MNTGHLAVVMFTDIEGYTHLMQTDEAAAMQLRLRHREVFEAAHAKFNGTVVQYFGDGTLSTFKSSRDAVECAIEMQSAFKESPRVPLRIGLHLGDVIVSGQDIAGDAVNVASRVESLGVSGSIFISSKVFDDIKNQNGIKTESMGFFEFKNVAKPREVFAIANRGLVVPDPESLVGKTKLKGPRKEASHDLGGVLKDLWNRKVFLVAAVYLIGLWLLLKAAGFIVSNYAISPYWPDVLLVFFISFLPSVILHSYYHNRLALNRMRLVEKITIPSNAMLSIALLFFLFAGKDLGATTRTVTLTDEFGNTLEKQVIKNEFLKKINFYPFTNETADSTLEWMGYGLAYLLTHDLVQSDYTWCNTYSNETLGDMIEHAQARNVPHFVTGNFQKQDSLYRITTKLYAAKNGRLLQERSVKGANVFDLVDELSVEVKKDVGISLARIQQAKDLPVREIFTDQPEAFKCFIQARQARQGGESIERENKHIRANEIDPSFAINYYYYAGDIYKEGGFAGAERGLIDQAMKYRTKVNDLYNMHIRTLYYNIYDQPEKAIALREMQAELNPEDEDAYQHLITEYTNNGDYEKALTAIEKFSILSPEITYIIPQQAYLLKLLNRSQEGLELMQAFVKKYPKNITGFIRLGDLHLALGNMDEAENNFNKVALMNPDHQGMAFMLAHIQYLRDKGDDYDPEMLKPFIGEYKVSDSEMIIQFTYLDKKLIAQGKNQGPFQVYPVNDSTLVSSFGIRTTYIKNEAGLFFKQIFQAGGFSTIFYSIDSTIRKAEKLLTEGKDDAALKAYEVAYEQHPEHYFLPDYINHLKYKLARKSISHHPGWDERIGLYQLDGNPDIKRSLSKRDHELYWRFRKIDPGIKVLPINDNEVVFRDYWGWKARFFVDAEKGVGVEFSLTAIERIDTWWKVDE